MADITVGNLAIVALVFVSVGFLFLYLWVRLRRRRSELVREPIPTRAMIEDRAFNQIHLGRAAAARLAQAGTDTSSVSSLLDRAEEARTRGDPDTAIALAQSARESLARLRTAPPGGANPSATTRPDAQTAASPGPMMAAFPGARSDAGARGALGPSEELEPPVPVAPTARLPKNKAESRFQISLLESDVAGAERARPADGDTREARRLLDDAQEAFQRGDYTEALRLGLRGRRRAGARLETLAPSRATVSEAPSVEEPSGGSTPPENGGGSCATCGAPLRASDGFCRACGAPKSSARCAQCGEALAGNDRFCGACGAPIRPE